MVISQVELFHLLFLEQMGLRLDKRVITLKGGCNLRFYFNSIRYSEDIDFDIHTVGINTLKKQVSKILDSQTFIQLLKTRGLAINEYTTPKQTATTQRWKIKLNIQGHSLPVNTKIEFSRRTVDQKDELANISADILLKYNLRPIFVKHYPADIALQQKIKALIGRTETQARDIFDIYWLLQKGAKLNQGIFSNADLKQAAENCRIVSFEQYVSQVVSYLELDHQKTYESSEQWKHLQSMVDQLLSEMPDAIN